MSLAKNDFILSPMAIMSKRTEGGGREAFGDGLKKERDNCHYIHDGGDMVAAMSVCGDEEDDDNKDVSFPISQLF